MRHVDKLIFGAGLYGLYAAERCGGRGERVLVLERDPTPFMRATYVNQARVHQGYHYPRSYSTAIKSARYFRRFCEDYPFCLLTDFDQVYATSSEFSWTDARQFQRFCEVAGIRCEEVSVSRYFRRGLCDGAFLTTEYTYDAHILCRHLLGEIERQPTVEVACGVRPLSVRDTGRGTWAVTTDGGEAVEAPFVLNATYAGANDVHALLGFEPFPLKYELCEIILCDVGPALERVGITVMDGPFFSIMPFGRTGRHSLTSVTFTPHQTSYEPVATFGCQARSEGRCAPGDLFNCNECPARPESAWPYMGSLARKYLRDDYSFSYRSSLFSMKPILKASEVDDARPTVIRTYSETPRFVSVLSGKINTVYDLDEVLDHA